MAGGRESRNGVVVSDSRLLCKDGGVERQKCENASIQLTCARAGLLLPARAPPTRHQAAHQAAPHIAQLGAGLLSPNTFQLAISTAGALPRAPHREEENLAVGRSVCTCAHYVRSVP